MIPKPKSPPLRALFAWTRRLQARRVLVEEVGWRRCDRILEGGKQVARVYCLVRTLYAGDMRIKAIFPLCALSPGFCVEKHVMEVPTLVNRSSQSSFSVGPRSRDWLLFSCLFFNDSCSSMILDNASLFHRLFFYTNSKGTCEQTIVQSCRS